MPHESMRSVCPTSTNPSTMTMEHCMAMLSFHVFGSENWQCFLFSWILCDNYPLCRVLPSPKMCGILFIIKLMFVLVVAWGGGLAPRNPT